MPSKLHHLAIEVSDAKRSAEFYCSLLGFRQVAEHHFPERQRTIIFVQLGEVRLELLQGSEAESYQATPQMVGFKHVCLQSEDVTGEIERLRAAGVKITMEPFDTEIGSRIAFFEDPDGLPLELWQTL